MGASPKCIFKVVKSLYGVSNAGNYWFVTYYNYQINIFTMFESTYNPCLINRCELFSTFGLQTNDTLMLTNNIFTTMEEKTIKTTKFMTEKQAYLLL